MALQFSMNDTWLSNYDLRFYVSCDGPRALCKTRQGMGTKGKRDSVYDIVIYRPSEKRRPV